MLLTFVMCAQDDEEEGASAGAGTSDQDSRLPSLWRLQPSLLLEQQHPPLNTEAVQQLMLMGFDEALVRI